MSWFSRKNYSKCPKCGARVIVTKDGYGKVWLCVKCDWMDRG